MPENFNVELPSELPITFELGVDLDQTVGSLRTRQFSTPGEASSAWNQALVRHQFLTLQAVKRLEERIAELEARP